MPTRCVRRTRCVCIPCATSAAGGTGRERGRRRRGRGPGRRRRRGQDPRARARPTDQAGQAAGSGLSAAASASAAAVSSAIIVFRTPSSTPFLPPSPVAPSILAILASLPAARATSLATPAACRLDPGPRPWPCIVLGDRGLERADPPSLSPCALPARTGAPRGPMFPAASFAISSPGMVRSGLGTIRDSGTPYNRGRGPAERLGRPRPARKRPRRLQLRGYTNLL